MQEATAMAYVGHTEGGAAVDTRDLWQIVAANLAKIVEKSEHRTKGEWSRAAGWGQDRLSHYLSGDPKHFRLLERLQEAVEAAGGDPRDLFVLDEVSVRDVPTHMRGPIEDLLRSLSEREQHMLAVAREQFGDQGLRRMLAAASLLDEADEEAS